MAELIEPFERELRRSRNYPRRRTDGISDDGLSYSVALDFDKQLGNALSEMDARSADPRFVPGARVENPDSPEMLRQELLDPVISGMNAYRGVSAPQPTRTASPRTYKFGDKLISVDPTTGTTQEIFAAEAKPDTRGDSFQKQVILGKISALQAAKRTPVVAYDAKRMAEIDTEIANLERQGMQLFEPGAIAPQADPLQPQPAPAAEASITSRQQFDALPSGAVYIGKNGKRYRKP